MKAFTHPVACDVGQVAGSRYVELLECSVFLCSYIYLQIFIQVLSCVHVIFVAQFVASERAGNCFCVT